jgi:kumamolisin
MEWEKKVKIDGSEAIKNENSSVVGRPEPGHIMGVTLHLRSRSYGTDEVSLPSGQVSRDEFEKYFGADPKDVELVKMFARRYRLTVVEVKIPQKVVYLEGSVRDMESAFGVKLNHYRDPFDKMELVMNCHEGPIHIPQRLEGIVLAVMGLSNCPVGRTRLHSWNRGDAVSHCVDLPDKCADVYFTPTEVASLYRFPTGLDGKGQTIGIIELGGGYEADVLEDYFSNYLQIPMPEIISVPVGKGANNPGKKQEYDDEVYVDIEIAGAVAPGARIVVYFAPSADFNGMAEALMAAVHSKDYPTTVISLSWGQKESQSQVMYMAIINRILEDASHLGITVCTASGDYGSSDVAPYDQKTKLAHVDFPASSPWTLACGGTKLIASANKKSIVSEVVWNDGQKIGATGGGVSAYFGCPSYQLDAGIDPVSVNKGAKKGRGVPDVTGNASPESGYLVQVKQKEITHKGGTSAVAPLWAGLVVLMNQKLGKSLGFINPLLYKLGDRVGVFNDITSGDNQDKKTVPGYSAATGWDPCSGLGSPNGEGLCNALGKLLEEGKG